MDKNAKDVNIELLMSKENMENELHDLMAHNYALEAELKEIKDIGREMKDRSSKPSDKTSTRMKDRASEKSKTDRSRANRTVPPSERSKKEKSETSVIKSKKSSFSPSKPRRSQPPVESKSTPTKQLNVGSNSDAQSRL